MHDVRLIDANALRKDIHTSYSDDLGILEHIDNAPTIEAQPVKRGKWIDVDYKTMEHGFIETYPNEGVCCSECRTGFKKSHLLVREYCPACGSHNGDE